MKGWEAESSREMTEHHGDMIEGMDRSNIGTVRAAPYRRITSKRKEGRYKRPEMKACLSSFLVALDSNILWGGHWEDKSAPI